MTKNVIRTKTCSQADRI